MTELRLCANSTQPVKQSPAGSELLGEPSLLCRAFRVHSNWVGTAFGRRHPVPFILAAGLPNAGQLLGGLMPGTVRGQNRL